MTLAEIIYTIRTLRSGGNTSDDDGVTDDQWAFIVDYYRAKLVKDRSTAGSLPQSLVQSLGKVELTKTPDPCLYEGACILRPVKALPKLVTTNKGQELITFVGSRTQPFSRTTFTGSFFTSHRRYADKLPYWYLTNDGIRIYQPPTQAFKYVVIQGVFEDPVEAAEYKDCKEAGCIGLEVEYPMPSDLMDTLVKMVAQAELSFIRQSIEDESNNLREDTIQKGPGSPPPRTGTPAAG